MTRFLNRPLALLALVLAGLTAVYWPTLQRIINGSSHLMMIDVGETQAVLNTWGTLHATGYPHYVILGNLLVSGFKLLGVSAATAPGLVSLLWGLLALALIFILAQHLTERPLLAAALTLVYGLTRFVWVHQVVAEIYSFSLLLLVALLVVALWERPIQGRILILAVLGGIAVAHYRTIAFSAPALMYATWPEFRAALRRPRYLGLCIAGALAGFVPYIYLPLRASAGARWVYGSPDTWDELWYQFRAGEANYLFGWPESTQAFVDNWTRINRLLVDEISLAGVLLGLVGLGIALWTGRQRRAALTLTLSALPAYGFAVLLYYDILALVILNMTLALAFGWLFVAEWGLARAGQSAHERRNRRAVYVAVGLGTALLALWLYRANYDFVYDLTHDRTGLETIELADHAPPDSTLMLAWGPRYFAVGFAQDVQGQLGHIRRADHNADFQALLAEGPLVTPDYTFFAQPVSWWEAKLGQPVYLAAAGPSLVAIRTAPALLSAEEVAALPPPEDAVPVVSRAHTLTCTPDAYILSVDWVALEQPDRPLSVLAHLLDGDGALLAQDDKFAPVFGLRPVTEWQPGEQVRDVYTLPRLPGGETIRYGLYEQLADGSFRNYNVREVAVRCGD